MGTVRQFQFLTTTLGVIVGIAGRAALMGFAVFVTRAVKRHRRKRSYDPQSRLAIEASQSYNNDTLSHHKYDKISNEQINEALYMEMTSNSTTVCNSDEATKELAFVGDKPARIVVFRKYRRKKPYSRNTTQEHASPRSTANALAAEPR